MNHPKWLQCEVEGVGSGEAGGEAVRFVQP